MQTRAQETWNLILNIMYFLVFTIIHYNNNNNIVDKFIMDINN